MSGTTLEMLTEMVELNEQLVAGRDAMLEPKDLPGRFGRAVHAVNHLLQVMGCESVLAGGWAVWRHGYSARVTQDLDIVLPANRVDEFLRVASVSGFETVAPPTGRWPKVFHKDSGTNVDILPEGARPGLASKPAPTTIPPPGAIGASGCELRYIRLPSLIELKIAAGRLRDETDVVELMRTNLDKVQEIRDHLATVHADYVTAFDRLVQRAQEQEDQ